MGFSVLPRLLLLCGLLTCLFSVNAFSAEMALTKSGKKVVLKNDGTWEFYDPAKHVSVSDIREEAPQISISVKYYNYKFHLDNKKLYWSGTGVEGKALQDSIKSVPKGGVIHLMIGSNAIDANDPKAYKVTLKDYKEKVVFEEEALDIQAVDSDEVGYSILKEIPLKKKYKQEVWIFIKDPASGQTFQYNLPMK